jgi:hypothetical protein
VNALVALGQGPELDAAVSRCLEYLRGRGEVQVAALESGISPRLDVPPGVVLVRDTYPVSRHYRAFDFVISAAGYNAYHELIRFGVPSLFVPMSRELDDQPARARYAERNGLALACEGPASALIEARLDEMLGHPETCPHGNPIDAETARRRPPGTPLSRVEAGEKATIYRITEEAEEDAGLLSYLEARALTPGAPVAVLARSESLDSLTLEGPRGRATLGLRPASLVHVLLGEVDPTLFHRVPDGVSRGG